MMFDLNIVPGAALMKFDRQLPIFNWYYPFTSDTDLEDNTLAPYAAFNNAIAARRSVYIHIPFCETICNFCPFQRDKVTAATDLDRYVEALTTEIDVRRGMLGRCRVDAIFVGGGTPSLLTPRHIARLGAAVERNFDLSSLTEFSFEVEAKSASWDRLVAMRDIGANRASFGAQTFSERYRGLLSLDATHEQIAVTAERLNRLFACTNVDVLYGMAGQTIDEVFDDLRLALELATTSIDVYPINNLAASRSMHRALAGAALEFLPATIRVAFRMHIEEFFRDHGYAPINGYSFAAAEGAHRSGFMVRDRPRFLYHDVLYGHADDEVVGYGSSALSRIAGFNLINVGNTRAYAHEILNRKGLAHQTFGPISAPERGIVLFPYRGNLEKSRVAWPEVPSETLAALRSAVAADLVIDRGDRYELTHSGWLFYVNLMYFLMPRSGKEWISRKIESLQRQGRRCGSTELAA
jgi:anaerobilin synthase